jgi:hypothetical protein
MVFATRALSLLIGTMALDKKRQPTPVSAPVSRVCSMRQDQRWQLVLVLFRFFGVVFGFGDPRLATCV